MFFKRHQIFFIIFLTTGTTIAVSSNSWFTCWIGLEINLMSLIPLILRELNFKSTEAAIKYFLAQAMASVILISSSCFSSIAEINFYLNNFRNVIFLSLVIKAGLAPFHLWFPQIIQCVSWFKCAIILTWQKIAPFVLIRYFLNKYFVYTIIASSALVGALGGFNQVDRKLILTYSSIAHSAWILIITYMSLALWLIYFIIYVYIVTPIIIIVLKNNISKITEINASKTSVLNKNLLIFIVLSLGGLPPFLGFSAKIVAILTGIKIFSFIILLILISSSLISLFFYTKLFYNLTINSMPELKILVRKKNSLFSIFLITPIIGNLILSLLVLLT
jgi:NADH:ubiquinone oxidoreductase subunit 2 (subunit N)